MALHACISRRPILVMQDLSKHFIVYFIYLEKSNMTLFGKQILCFNFNKRCVIDFSWPKLCLLDTLKNTNSDYYWTCGEEIVCNVTFASWNMSSKIDAWISYIIGSIVISITNFQHVSINLICFLIKWWNIKHSTYCIRHMIMQRTLSLWLRYY